MLIIDYFKRDATGAATKQVRVRIANNPHGGVTIHPLIPPSLPPDLQVVHLHEADAEAELDGRYPAAEGWVKAIEKAKETAQAGE